MFHYFESKAALYEELIRIGVSGPASVMTIDASDPMRFFEAAASGILTALRSNPFAAKMFVLMEQAPFNTSVSESVRTLVADSHRVFEKTADYIKAGQQCGQIRPGNPQALAVLFCRALSGVALYAALYPDAAIPEAEWIIDCIRSKQA